jgi:protein KRI1
MAAMLAETDGLVAGGDDEKPTWDEDIDVGDIAPSRGDEVTRTTAAKERKKAKKKERKKRMEHDVDASGVDLDEMDADAPKDSGTKWDEVEWDGTEEMRKRVLDQYMNELYELEFNDMVRLFPFLTPRGFLSTRTIRMHSGRGYANPLSLQLSNEGIIRAERCRNPARG